VGLHSEIVVPASYWKVPSASSRNLEGADGLDRGFDRPHLHPHLALKHHSSSSFHTLPLPIVSHLSAWYKTRLINRIYFLDIWHEQRRLHGLH